MSSTYIPAALRREVAERAKHQCEYCLLPANVSFFPHEIDHVIAQKHGGRTEADNLALTGWRCNRHKGTDLGSLDPQTGKFSFLFNPRTQSSAGASSGGCFEQAQEWSGHFTSSGNTIDGLTSEGRTTAKLLQFNSEERLAERQRLGTT